jgi:hemin uptake protein HemP
MTGAMVDKPNQEDHTLAEQSLARMPRTISSRELFGNEKLVIVRHEQESYRLQMTASGKLLLTK